MGEGMMEGVHQHSVKTPSYGATRTCICLLSDVELGRNGCGIRFQGYTGRF